MSTAGFLLEDFDIEISNTRRTLERVPNDKTDWVPHPKSMPLGKLAMHCATLPHFGFYILEDDGMDMANSERRRAALAAASDEHLAKVWPFSFGEHIISSVPRSKTFRLMCLNHLIHHTAQLGVYLRLNDIPVPALYGPSADEQWSPK